ncbi:MAG: hypothetical protein WDN69_02355 [Aliidongia sp.]
MAGDTLHLRIGIASTTMLLPVQSLRNRPISSAADAIEGTALNAVEIASANAGRIERLMLPSDWKEGCRIARKTPEFGAQPISTPLSVIGLYLGGQASDVQLHKKLGARPARIGRGMILQGRFRFGAATADEMTPRSMADSTASLTQAGLA